LGNVRLLFGNLVIEDIDPRRQWAFQDALVINQREGTGGFTQKQGSDAFVAE
jgi:hypothetical protein